VAPTRYAGPGQDVFDPVGAEAAGVSNVVVLHLAATAPLTALALRALDALARLTAPRLAGTG
jgi:hypothetical protein